MIVKNSLIEDPLTVAPETQVIDLITLLIDSAHETAAVIDHDGALRGMVGIHDIFKAIVPYYIQVEEDLMNVIHEGYFEEKFQKIKHKTAKDLMVQAVDSVEPSDAVIKAVSIFVNHRRKALPVIEDGRFVGMITRTSVLDRLRFKLNLTD